ncbi:MAG: TRAP transporter large permease subunit [Verrucomicrobia bacterium]|nr:TRAP transporter large permease subunit [Verrucomicrobiota bacterium]
MNPELPTVPSVAGGPPWLVALRRAEDLLIVLALAIMVALPCAEIVARKFFQATVPASSTWVQHLVLIVGMLGGALAARDNRLLSLSTLTTFFPPRAKSAAHVFANAVAAVVSLCLCLASLDVVLESQRRGRILALGIPIWVIQLILVLGFGAVALRLLWHGGNTWRKRLLAVAIAAVLLGMIRWLPLEPAQLRLPALVILIAAAICGLPVFSILGGAALIFFWSGGDPVSTIPNKHYTLTVNPTLPSIPLFTLAGYFLAEGGAARRFVALFQAVFGGIRGGPAIVTVMVCAFFTSFTGASGVTILALGGLLMPILMSSGYSERNSLGLLTGAGSLGLLFPPCLPPILYSIVASSGGATSIRMEEMFQGGLLPGLLLMGMTMAWGVSRGSKQAAREHRFDARVAWGAIWAAKWELLIPVVALVALFGGFATPVEAAAITALYAFVVETFIYRDLKLLRDVPRVMAEAGLLIGGVLLILGVALGFTHFLIVAQVPDKGVEWVTATIESKWLFLLALNLVLLIVGCLMDVYSAIVVVVPLLIPVANAFGIDPIHLGIIFLANLELGYLTPPVGMNLFLASYRFNKPVPEVARASLPMLGVLAVGVLLITYLPWLTTWLPGQLK